MTVSNPPPETHEPADNRRRPRARKGEGPRLRTEILEATENLLLRTGAADAVSIRAVADAVGVTPPSIYRHFADKDVLIAEVSARHFQALRDEMSAAAAGIDDPIERLTARGAAYIRFGSANPEPYRILFMTRHDKVPEDLQQTWLLESDLFMDVVTDVQDCIDQGRLAPDLQDAYTVTLGIWARVHGLTALAVSKPFLPLTDDEFISHYADACLHGVVDHAT